jgi:hypothetical protein
MEDRRPETGEMEEWKGGRMEDRGNGIMEWWMLDSRMLGCWILDAGYSMLDTGYWMLDTRCWILDARYSILDARC